MANPAMRRESADFRRAFEELERYGILLESDPRLPSVAGLISGEPVKGSWWGHPRGGAIFGVTRELGDHPDALVTKLVSGKVTYVHRRLWPVLFAVGCARERWQIDGLSPAAQRILDAVTRNGELRTDDVPWTGGRKTESPGEAARELERRLLVHSEEVHTSRGAHAKRLETWERWASRIGFAAKGIPAEQAKETLEEVVAGLNRQFEAKGRLPWRAEGVRSNR